MLASRQGQRRVIRGRKEEGKREEGEEEKICMSGRMDYTSARCVVHEKTKTSSSPESTIRGRRTGKFEATTEYGGYTLLALCSEDTERGGSKSERQESKRE